MYIEFACLDYSLTETDLQNKIKYAVDNGIKNICSFSYSINLIKSIDPEIKIFCPVDFPYGILDTKNRNNIISSLIKNNIAGIDLVIPTKIISNRKYEKLRDDIRSNIEICKNNGLELRYMLEYRVYSHEILAKICQILKDLGIDTILPSTGIMLDDINDNLIACNFLNTKSNIQVICNGNIYTEKHVKNIKKGDLYGVRLHHTNSIGLFLNLK
jgi:deoxyribose-phosphate aldolase